jgi:hypothetical protein
MAVQVQEDGESRQDFNKLHPGYLSPGEGGEQLVFTLLKAGVIR